ncbi:MAG: lipoprotein [Pseudomonadota bacterium]
MKTNTLLSLLIVAALAACGQKTDAPPAVVVAPAPVVAAPVVAAAPAIVPASAEVLAVGEKVYTATCAACHAAAVMGAPKLGDKPSWTPRMAKGAAALHTTAIEGLKLMPAKGGNPALKDDEVKAAVDYMVSKVL